MRFRTRLMIVFTVLLTLVLAGNFILVAVLGRRTMRQNAVERVRALVAVLEAAERQGLQMERAFEDNLGGQMIVQACLAAHLVDVAENKAGLTSEEINARLTDVTARTVLDEFYITDSTGHAYLRNSGAIDFTFPAGPTERNQAGEFRRLLTSRDDQLVQLAMEREHDGEVFKYVGVSGIDEPRIVQVGYNAGSLREFASGMRVEDMARAVVGHGGIMRIRGVGEGGEIILDTELPGPPEPDAHTKDESLGGLVTEARAANRPVVQLQGSMLTLVSPVLAEAGPYRGFVTNFDITPITSTVNRTLTSLTLVTVAVLLLGIFLAGPTANRIARPIQSLAEEAAEIGQGNLDREIDIHTTGEVGALAVAFRNMTSSLKEHIREIQSMSAARERLESELRIAAQIQAWMLPRRLPGMPGVRLAASMRAAKEVGGDFYDLVERNGGRLGLLIGDASGKGIPGALYAAQTLSVLRALSLDSRSTSGVISAANSILLVSGEEGSLFSTVFYGIYDTRSRVLRYANAAHCLPALLRAGHAPEWLPAEGSPPVGLFEDYDAVDQEVTLGPGDRVVFYSDGVTEARNPENELFGPERLLQCLERYRTASLDEMLAGILAEVKIYADGRDQSDDVTVAILEVTA